MVYPMDDVGRGVAVQIAGCEGVRVLRVRRPVNPASEPALAVIEIHDEVAAVSSPTARSSDPSRLKSPPRRPRGRIRRTERSRPGEPGFAVVEVDAALSAVAAGHRSRSSRSCRNPRGRCWWPTRLECDAVAGESPLAFVQAGEARARAVGRDDVNPPSPLRSASAAFLVDHSGTPHVPATVNLALPLFR